jgi:hypothetical protein
MALGAMEKHMVNVKLVPCAIHYYRQDLFRAEVIVEYGDPISVPAETLRLYEKDKKQAISELLITVEKVCSGRCRV